MNHLSPFKPNAIVFNLPTDFPDQVLFPEPGGGASTRKGPPLLVPMEDFLVVGLSNFAFGRYYFYGAGYIPDSAETSWFIWDGVFLMPVEPKGLFAEMLATAKRVYGEQVEQALWPQIHLPSTPADHYAFSSDLIVHDTLSNTASWVSFAEARSLFRKDFNP